MKLLFTSPAFSSFVTRVISWLVNKTAMSSIKINLLINKPKYTSNLGDNNFRVYTPGESITEQKDFMRSVNLQTFYFSSFNLNVILEAMALMLKTDKSNHRLSAW